MHSPAAEKVKGSYISRGILGSIRFQPQLGRTHPGVAEAFGIRSNSVLLPVDSVLPLNRIADGVEA